MSKHTICSVAIEVTHASGMRWTTAVVHRTTNTSEPVYGTLQCAIYRPTKASIVRLRRVQDVLAQEGGA